MTGPAAITLSLLMLAGVLLTAGGLWTMVKGHNRTRATLMFVAALVMFANVAIWTVPIR